MGSAWRERDGDEFLEEPEGCVEPGSSLLDLFLRRPEDIKKSKKEKKKKKKKKHKKEKKKDKHHKRDAASSSSDSSPDRDER